jgi:hypothetical protein
LAIRAPWRFSAFFSSPVAAEATFDIARLIECVGVIGPEIEYAGFLDGQEMIDALMEADLALVPFNVTASAEHDYARYSLPSRLTELVAVGVPILCIASADTPVARYLSQNRVGVTGDTQNP